MSEVFRFKLDPVLDLRVRAEDERDIRFRAYRLCGAGRLARGGSTRVRHLQQPDEPVVPGHAAALPEPERTLVWGVYATLQEQWGESPPAS